MVLTDKQKQLLRWIGYPLLAVVTFVYAAWLTFPADRLEDRLMKAVEGQADVSMEDFSLSWIPGKVTATNVVIRPKPKKPAKDDEEPRAIIIDELDVGIGLLSLLTGTVSVDIRAEAGDGVIDGTFEKSGDDLYFAAETDDMPVKMMPGLSVVFAGLPANKGTLDATVRIELPEGKWELANGELDLACSECSVGPGKVKPTARPGRKLDAFKAQGVTLPELQLGDATAVMEIEEGRGTLREFATSSTDGELTAEGYMDFKDPVGRTELNFCARFKFTDEVKKNNPKLAAMETGLEKARRDDGFIGMRLSRTIERPRRKGSRDCVPGKEPNSRRPDSRSRSRPTPPRTTAAKPALPPSVNPPTAIINGARDDDEGDLNGRDEPPSIPPPSAAPARIIPPEAAARLGRGVAGAASDDEADGDDDVDEDGPVDDDSRGDDGDFDDEDADSEDEDDPDAEGDFDEQIIE